MPQKSARAEGAISLPIIIPLILAGVILLSFLFYFSWQRLNQKVEVILQDQFNQQQLELVRKIADNIEAYFDYLENELLVYGNVFRNIQPDSTEFRAFMGNRVMDLQHIGILEVRRFNAAGVLVSAWGSGAGNSSPRQPLVLPEPLLKWTQDPKNRGRLFLGKVHRAAEPPWQGRLVMPFLTQVYRTEGDAQPFGSLELVIDPFFIAQKVTKGVRSGETGYPWIIDQDGIFLAHFEKDFVGQDALQVRIARNPRINYRELREIQAKLLRGQEGTGEYVSGWHRQKRGEIPKLVAYTPVKFERGLITGVTEVQDPAHNLWGVAVVAPVAEVSGHVAEVLHQALFLVGLFFLVVLMAGGGMIGVALTWNRTLSREVAWKTRELLESQERLMRSERFAAVGEAASYVSHEIKNPLMVIGGLAQQVERRLAEDEASKEKLHIIQEEVRRLENFLGDLRDFLKPVLPIKQFIDLNQIIQEVQSLMAETAQEKGVRLTGQLAPRLPQVEADPNQIKQVLLNLIKNSLEAMDSGGQITLATGTGPNQVWFSIQDTGAGMTEEVLESIFNPFFTTKDKGTGLGLAVIHKIITDHHGTIRVESSPGRGAKFLVKLPCSP
jgi:two-component system sensor histidine kinase HydH